LGAGANPEIGKQSCEESIEDIGKILKVNTRMAFITAGMGGGTGTGGAPVVAKICRELGILTVGIVTTPFTYEGRKRMQQAQAGIDRMREHVDTILIISNDKLRQQFGNLPFTKAFAKADDILATAAKCITDVINSTGQINVDFADVCTVMRNGGVAILGSAQASGEKRARQAVEEALNSPLLNDSDIRGAKWLLLNITSAPGEHEHTMDEAEEIQAYVQMQAGENCDVILGMGHDPNLGDKLAVTVIATGFNYKEIHADPAARRSEGDKISVTLSAPSHVAEPRPDELMQVTSRPDSYMPTLVQEPVAETAPVVTSYIPVAEEPVVEQYVLNVEETPAREDVVAPIVHELQSEPSAQPYHGYTSGYTPTPEPVREPVREQPVMKIGERVLTEREMEEKRIFEEQKRALEDRAARLRSMSMNVRANEGNNDHIEDIPAYVRKNMAIENPNASANNFYSDITVGRNNDGGPAGIQTANSFLNTRGID
jgi:cell division protein FtsZ